jgi:hypothetical protein
MQPQQRQEAFDDIRKAKDFYGRTLGLECTSGPEGTLVVPLSGNAKALMYPKPNHQPATSLS